MRRVVASVAGGVLLTATILGSAVGSVSVQAQIDPTPVPGGLRLFEDDFSTYSRRWQEKTTPKALTEYREGAFRILIGSPGVYAWSVPDFDTSLNDYRVEVSAVFESGSPDSWLGIVLDYTGDAGFYAWMVGLNGKWCWLRHQENEWIDLTPDDAGRAALAASASSFRLRVDAAGSMLAFFVDGKQIGVVEAGPESRQGTFGLIVRAGHGYAEVRFDDVLVTRIDEGAIYD